MKQSNNSHVIHDESILTPYLEGKKPTVFSDKLAAFIKHQCETWPELQEARDFLKQSLIRKIFLTSHDSFLQHNPQRIKSSSTRIDKEFIEKRPCFLCPDRLYENQKALLYQREWLILNNPYPIFPNHLVIAHAGHLPQVVHSCLRAMPDFVADLNFSCTAFYNGPACGASAPDHLHFQACPDGGIPITGQLAAILKKKDFPFTLLEKDKGGACLTGELDSRAFFMCITGDRDFLRDRLTGVVKFLKEETRSVDEPMINLLIAGLNETEGFFPSVEMSQTAQKGFRPAAKFMGIIFPRKAHRPACYFKKNEDMLMVSPGTVDIGGLIILPRREDYERMERDLLLGIFSEVCYGEEIFKNLCL
ncbi:MAG: DUF4922 domain-containing protein [Pseudomonadota bacterium]